MTELHIDDLKQLAENMKAKIKREVKELVKEQNQVIEKYKDKK